ncbi:MAG TPA: amidohydrolase [bacterium]|nr:amidohydrolase [bacterium]
MKYIKTVFTSSLILVLITLFSFGCSAPIKPADLIVTNAHIVTINEDQPRAQAIAVKGEYIIAVGADEQIQKYAGQGTRIIDANGRLLIPGLNDAHVHFLSGGWSLKNLDFRYIRDIRQIQEMVRDRVAAAKPGEVIRGRGWDHELFPDKQWPNKEMLDAVAPEHPVILSRADGHSVWVNSVVIRQSGIHANTPDPHGGTIVRDPQTGEPTGIFKETAQQLLKIESPYPLTKKQHMEMDADALELALEEARRTGVTSIQHLNDYVDLLHDFLDRGKLTARVTFNMWLTDEDAVLAQYDSLRKEYPHENNWLRFGYLKAFMDGTLGSGTALMFRPFEDDPSTAGLPQSPYEELEKKVKAADRNGFQIGIHAIGNKANHWVLNAYEAARKENRKRDSRHRIEHAQILIDEDIPRFRNLGVIASMQPTHCITDKRFAENRLGLDRCRGAYAWRRLLDEGASIAFGTDWPVEPLDPLEGLYASVTRKDRDWEPGEGWFPDQKLSMEEAIRLYTAGSAYAEFMEKRKGRLKKGYLADMVLYDRDLMTLPPEEIMKARVDFTIVGGKIVFDREGVFQ